MWVKFIAGGEPANLTASLDLSIQSQDYIGGLQISPDGSLIAFAAGPRGALPKEFASWVIPAPLGGAPRRILDGGNQGLAWSPDGLRIASVRTGGSAGDAVWVADSDGQHARQYLTQVNLEGCAFRKIVDLPATTMLRGLAWAPDGSALTVGVVTRSGDIVLAERVR